MALLADTPFIFSLRSPSVLPSVAEADAFADDLGCGLGGCVTWSSEVSWWFFLHWSAEHLPLFSAFAGPHISLGASPVVHPRFASLLPRTTLCLPSF